MMKSCPFQELWVKSFRNPEGIKAGKPAIADFLLRYKQHVDHHETMNTSQLPDET